MFLTLPYNKGCVFYDDSLIFHKRPRLKKPNWFPTEYVCTVQFIPKKNFIQLYKITSDPKPAKLISEDLSRLSSLGFEEVGIIDVYLNNNNGEITVQMNLPNIDAEQELSK